MPTEKVNEITRLEWRELGFFYDRNTESKEWRVVGSARGLLSFLQELRNYALNPGNAALSEHIHLGPYMYLKIGTWSKPEITDDWIAGPPESFLELAAVAENLIPMARIGQVFKLREVFAPSSQYELLLEVANDEFDPARADAACWE